MNLANATTLDRPVAETVDFYRIDASKKLEAKHRAALGQYMTPLPIARFLASLFKDLSGNVSLLDPGAGVGSLSVAAIERACEQHNPRSIELTAFEIDDRLASFLGRTLEEQEAECHSSGIELSSSIIADDFILSHPLQLQLQNGRGQGDGFSHVILNPPYKKISANSPHRKAMRVAGLETSNLYTGFMFLAAQLLREGGEMVAIIPRSFCNGPYFKPFREAFLAMMAIDHIHIFERRNSAFKDDEVLQENIILHAVKGAPKEQVKITTSRGGDFTTDDEGECSAQDMTERLVPYNCVVRENDPDSFIHIASNEIEQAIADRMGEFHTSLGELGLEISTGPVVDFRLKEDLRADPENGSVPLLYPVHFRGREIEWPKQTKKPNAIRVSEQSRRWLWSNSGHYVVTKRFTSKEEPRRVVASVYDGSLPGELVGFENHLNVFHAKQTGVSAELACGLAVYLNSSLVDRFFRQFNGHTQVNATDLRSLRYPQKETLERFGQEAGNGSLSQNEIDNLIEKELGPMADGTNPIEAQKKIDEALEILKALGMPRGQQNERSALTLLAMLNMEPGGDWIEFERPLKGITPIMEFCRESYGREYAPNTRETFRRQTMHQFVEAGIAVYNPDEPTRAVNSPKACYQISQEAAEVVAVFGTDGWADSLEAYLEGQETLAAKWAKHREMQMIPVTVADGEEIKLTPGVHSELIKQIITDFAPRFAPGSEVIYVGDTGDKIGYFQAERLAGLGVAVDQHGKMPDVVLYFGDKGWLLLIESVTSHGPVDAKRHNELAALFAGSSAGLVYVTAFPDRQIMGRYLGEISWETEVWCADAPTHLIHFNGERFLGPYENQQGE